MNDIMALAFDTRKPGADVRTFQEKNEAALLAAFRRLSFKSQIQLLKAVINNLGSTNTKRG